MGLEELLGDDVQVLALLVDHAGHVGHDGIDPESGLLHLVNECLLLG